LDPSNPWPTWNPDFPYLLLDPSGDDELLVREARDLIFAGCIDGTRCPCCTQFVKLYGRPLTGSLGYCLKWLVRAVSGLPVETGPRGLVVGTYTGEDEVWVDARRSAPDSVMREKHYASLAYWRLVDVRPEGWVRPTVLGIAFACGAEEIPNRAYVFLGRVVAYSDVFVGFTEATGLQPVCLMSPTNGDLLASSRPRPFRLVPREV